MAAPMLGLVLIGALSVAFYYQIRHQNTLLTHIAETELKAYERYARMFSALSEQHLALVRLLQQAQSIDEGTLYDQGKQHLDAIFETVLELEEIAGADEEAESTDHDRLQAQLLTRTREYRQAITTAVEMTTVSLSLAPSHLVDANERFVAMNRAFIDIIDSERRQVSANAAASVEQGEANSRVLVLTSVLAAVVLLVLSFVLARLLSRSLERQTQALAELGIRAGANISIEGSDEVERIARSITVFENAVDELRDHEQALESANRRLTETAEQLRKARDELELRVQERTRELRDKNQALESEIEMRRAAEDHLMIYAEVIRSTGEAVIITDPSGTIVEVNPAYEHAVGETREDLVGRSLYRQAQDEETTKTYLDLWRALRREGHWAGEIIDQRSNGEIYPCWILINAIRDDQGEPVHYVCVSRDITALKQNEEQLKHLAFYDPLTRLPNRALFHDRLDVAIANAQRQGTLLAVMYLDLDRFKYVNDTLGHTAGDRLLVEVGRRIDSCVRAADTVARQGGDEFVVLLTDLDSRDSAVRIADRIIEAVGTSMDLGTERVYVGVSIGISFFPDDGPDSAVIQKNADLAMYEAKEGGRNHYRMYSPDMSDKSGGRLALSVKLDAALHNGEFTLHYQPIVNSQTGYVDIVEALIRWPTADGQMILAEDFISHAEESGLIRKIDTWVLEQACRDAVAWQRDDNRRIDVCVNLSAVSVQQPSMPRIISDILQRTGMPPELLNLEVTETAMISNPQVAQQILTEISALGVKLTIDDFGVSHSSLSYLARFPISCIKLDRMFTARIGRDKTSEEIIRSLLELARKLHLRVVAEGVEHQSQQTFLSDAGCELMQGFHFVKPMPGGDLSNWLTKWNLDSSHNQATERD